VLEYISAEHALSKEVGICFAYYNYKSPEMQDLSLIISAIIKQLCRNKDTVPSAFLRNKQESLSPSTIGNQESFALIAQQFHELFLVVDGLDECPRAQRPPVLGFLSAVVEGSPRVKIFVTSRRETDLVQGFGKLTAPTIELEAESVAADISKYVTDEIKVLREGHNGKRLYLKSSALELEIINTLTTKAEGM
jgi:ankyrin repeat domain-containing protein 50